MSSRGLFPFTKEYALVVFAVIAFTTLVIYLNHIKVISNFLFGLIGAIFGICVIILVVFTRFTNKKQIK